MWVLESQPAYPKRATNWDPSQIMDTTGNEYGKPKDVAGEQRTVFTSHADAPFDVCFENVLTGCASCTLPHPSIASH